MKPERKWNQVAEAVFNSVGLAKLLFLSCSAASAPQPATPSWPAQEETLRALATIAGAAAMDNRDYEYGLWPFENIDAKPDSPGASP